MPVGYTRVLLTAFILQRGSNFVSCDNISLYMQTASATVPHQYTNIVSIYKSIMYLILSTGNWPQSYFTGKG